MVFSSLVFLSLFFPIMFLLYYIVRVELRNILLLLGSLLFYAWGEPQYLFLMLCVIIFTYVIGRILSYGIFRRTILTVAIFILISILFYYKYSSVVFAYLSRYSSFFPVSDVVLPIGISFFIFQAVSYLVDVYRNDNYAEKDIYNIGLYIALFPQLIAGPIIKYHDIYSSLRDRFVTIDDIVYGLRRFSFGLGKKVLIANTLAGPVDIIFTAEYNTITFAMAWLGAICYTFQLYFDFSGYSDMAIGLGRIFGFRFPENFNYPYCSRSISEFWRRWHIALGTWFREYIYIPLGGSKVAPLQTYANLALVFFITGIWHGANRTYLIWGLWHGVFVILERIVKIDQYTKGYQLAIRQSYTFFICTLGWVMFRSDTIPFGMRYIRTMLGLRKHEYFAYDIWYYLDAKIIVTLVIGGVLSLGVARYTAQEEGNKYLLNALALSILLLSVLFICASTYNPFIYFRY